MRTRLILAFALLVLTAAACGDDDTGEEFACDSLVSLDDVTALFGEPAVFDTEISEEDPAAGMLDCVWASVESADDEDDLQVQLFQIQVYRGREYYAPDLMYEDPEPIAGIGEDAFFSPQLGVSTGFRDGDLVAFLTFSVIDTGEAPDSITKKEQVIDLLRLVHDRLS